MVLYKYGESFSISSANFRSSESVKDDPELHDRFVKIAANWKKIAPKAEDFLYFTAIMMHAAERALIDEDGNIIKNADGKNAEAHWDVNERTGSWKWVCNNPLIKPYKNCNSDIFPEKELKIAYKQWIGKPLCKDHQSSSVDGVRGFIVDTYWDDKHKRIIALCALDKVSYPDLARKVSTGYLNDVSMGVAVGASVCFECGNVAHTEHEYCNHVKSRGAYGEINTALSPIELSLVVNGADKKAKILEVLASAKQIESELIKSGSIDINKIKSIKQDFTKLSNKIDEIEKEILSNQNDNNSTLKVAASLSNYSHANDIDLIRNKMDNIESMIQSIATKLNMEDLMSISKKAYYQGTEEPTPGKAQYPKEEADKIRMQDSHMRNSLTDLGPVDGLPKKDLETKKMLARAAIEERRYLRAAAVERAQNAIKKAYNVGGDSGEELPKGGYPKDPGAKVRDTEFKFNNSIGNTGLMSNDEKVKAQLARAALKARLVKAASVGDNRWEIVNKANNSVLLSASFNELTGRKPALFASIASDSFAREMMKNVRAMGIRGASKFYKSAQAAPPPPPPADAGGDPGDAMPPDDAAMPADAGAAGGGAAGGGTAGGKVEVDGAAIKEVAKTLKEVSTKISDMAGGTEALKEEGGELPGAGAVMENPEAATEQALSDLTGGGGGAAGGVPATASLNTLRIVLNAGLNKSFGKNIKALRAAKEELSLLVSSARNNSISPEFWSQLSREAVVDANKILRKSRMLQAAFVKYAKGTMALEKRAHMEYRMRKMAQLTKTPDQVKSQWETGKMLDQVGGTDANGEFIRANIDPRTKEKTINARPAQPPATPPPATPPPAPTTPTTASERRWRREKLAAAVESKMKYSDMTGKAHPKSDTKLGDIASTSEGVVEGIDSIHSQMMDSVSSEPKVKKAAAQLNKLIVAGKVNASDIPEMVKEGLDKDVANYWRKYYGDVDGGNEFASALLKDYSSAKTTKKASEDLDNYKAKYAKAYELAYEMSESGMINRNNSAIKAEADKIVGYDDNAYGSMKKVVAHHMATMKKTASVQVGLALDSNSTITQTTDGSLYDELVSAFSGRKY
ncbi:MAG: hypothetical protein ACOYMA_00360 [Bacteroidia bacterium]